MRILTKQLVDGIDCSERDAMIFIEPLNITINRYRIETIEQIASFLAQVAYESMRFSQLEENLNYSDLSLANTWPQRYGDKNPDGSYKKISVAGKSKIAPNSLAKSIHRKPEQIANITYANRLGNDSESSGDGWKYRGRGLIMITGKYNYRRTGIHLKVDLISRPELLTTPIYAALSAGYFWQSNKLNNKTSDIQAVTRVVSGSYVTANKREIIFDNLIKVFKNA